MTELLVAGFQGDIHRASGVLDDLRVLDDQWILELADAVAVHRDITGLVSMDQSYQPTGRRAAEWGRCLGILIGASLSIPFLANACPFVEEGVVTAAGLGRIGIAGIDASFWEKTLGIPQNFFEQAAQLVLPGNSAIYAVLEVSDADIAGQRFVSYGARILQLSLRPQQQRNIDRLLREGAGAD